MVIVNSLVVVVVVLAPRLAEACAVCFSANDENRSAFLYTTIFMSLLPLAIVGGLFWWYRKRVKAQDGDGTSDGSSVG